MKHFSFPKQITSALLVLVLLVSMCTIGFVNIGAISNDTIINYEFAYANPGYAQGRITVEGGRGSYFLYWADDTKALEGYHEIAVVANSMPFEMGWGTVIPAGATKVIAIQCDAIPTNTTVANADAVFDIPADKQFEGGTKQYDFMAISDIHNQYDDSYWLYSKTHFANALEVAAKRGVDFMTICGDMVNGYSSSNLEKEYPQYLELIARSNYNNPVYETNGNHEMKGGSASQNLDLYKKYTGLNATTGAVQSAPYYEKTINGDHYLFLVLEISGSPTESSEFTTAQLDWFEGLLKKYQNDGHKIIVNQHVLIRGYGAGDNKLTPYFGGGLKQEYADVQRLMSIMEEYPDIIMMNAHSHIDFKYGYNFDNENGNTCYTVHIPSVSSTTHPNSSGTTDYIMNVNSSQGYLVDVYDDYVVLNGTDLAFDKIYPAYSYMVDYSGDELIENEIGDIVYDTYSVSIDVSNLTDAPESVVCVAIDPYELMNNLSIPMTKNADGTYSAEVAECFSDMYFVINGATGVKTDAFPVSNCKITLGYQTLQYTPSTSVNFVRAHVWGNGGDGTTWPGTTMTKTGSYYTARIPASDYTGVVFNWGDSYSNQSADLNIADYITEKVDDVYEEIAVDVAETELAPVGAGFVNLASVGANSSSLRSEVKTALSKEYQYASYDAYMALKKAYMNDSDDLQVAYDKYTTMKANNPLSNPGGTANIGDINIGKTGTGIPAHLAAMGFTKYASDGIYGVLSNGLSYSEKTVGEITITGYSGGSDYVVIPEKIKDLPVTSISTGVFTGDVARVYIPASVTVIEDSAFTSGDAHIFYPGTSSEWKSSIAIGEDNDIVYDGTRHYNVIDSDVYASTVVESTCKEKGYTVYTCSICGDSYKIYTTALAQHNYLSDVVAPTCKEQGYTLYTCSVCGYSYKDDYIDQVSHNIIDGKCTYCNQEYEIVESAHNYAPDTDYTWIIERKNASSISISFSNDTFVENKYDYIYLYDENDVQIGKYTGSELASASVVVNGSVAKIRLVSDDSGNYYGFHATIVYEMIETNRIYLTIPSSWSGAYIYGFYGVLGETCTYEPFGAYPGTAMDYVKTDENGQKVYCAEIPADIDYIKFNDGTSSGGPNYRTENIPASLIYDNVGFKITTMGTKYWNYTTDVPEETTATEPTESVVTDSTETTVSEDVPETGPDSVESVYYLRGTMCGWVPGKVMTLNSDGSASITLSLAAGTYTFKIYNSETDIWYSNAGTIEDTMEGWTFNGGVGDCTLNATGGTYTFKCYTNSYGRFKVDVTKLSPEEPTEATVSTVPEESTAHVESTVTPTVAPAFSGASLTLQDNLCINFKANETLFTEVGYENPYVVFELNGEEFTVSDYEVVSGKYVFDFADIAPNNMNDTVKATLYATFNGVEYVSETREYSVATYCYNMLNKYTTPAYAELQTLLVDLLNYGAMSQTYTGHNTDNLVNAKLTDAQKAWGTAETPTYESVQNLAYKTIENPTVQWKGGGLNLVDAVTMRFKISANSGSYENLVVKVETDDRIWTIPFEAFTETTGGYYVYFSGLNAGEMSETVYLTVYENGVAVSNTLSYSIESYAYSKQNSTDTNLVNLLEAMMKYGNSAYAYAN